MTEDVPNVKPRFDLIPSRALLEVAKVFTYGITAPDSDPNKPKHSEHGWRVGGPWSAYYAAKQRHQNSYWSGEDLDPESGFHHLAHDIVNDMILLEYYFSNLGDDDRADRTDRIQDVRIEDKEEFAEIRRESGLLPGWSKP